MEEDVLDQVPDFKLHKKATITVCIFLTGPFVGGFLIAENFRQLNERQKAVKTWIFTIAGTVLLFYLILFVPAVEKIPGIVFPVVYTSIASYFVQRYQEDKIKLHQKNGGQFFPVWRAVIASAVSLTVTFGLLYLAFYFADQV